jgi:hypothetical protein
MENPDAPKCQPMPDCMMPDGTEPCAGYRIEAERHTQEREANNALYAEIERLRVVIVVAKDALLDVQSMQWVHDLLASALHRDEHADD